VSLWAAVSGLGRVGAQRGLQEFADLRAATELSVRQAPDQRLWSPERKRAWEVAVRGNASAPLAILRIPRIALEVAVREGTDDWTLNQGVGHIEDTARPGEDGNVGIAGHRDGFFRELKEMHPGDWLEIETIGAVNIYQVERTWIVDGDEVSVLDRTGEPAVTLVTCYPFQLVGSAPQRFIVRAVWAGTRSAGAVLD
jgi:sortase A